MAPLKKGLSPQARWVYAVSELTLDLAFPLLYTAFLRLLMNHLAAGLPADTPGAAWLVRLPYLLLAADLLENTGIILLLLSYPPPIPALTLATALASALKWLAGLACMGSIIAGSVWLEIKSLRKK